MQKRARFLFLFCISFWDIFANLSISCGYRSRFIALLDYLKPCFCKLFVFDESRLSVQIFFFQFQKRVVTNRRQLDIKHQIGFCQSLKYTFFLLLHYKVMRVGSVTLILLPLFSKNITKLEDLHTVELWAVDKATIKFRTLSFCPNVTVHKHKVLPS